MLCRKDMINSAVRNLIDRHAAVDAIECMSENNTAKIWSKLIAVIARYMGGISFT